MPRGTFSAESSDSKGVLVSGPTGITVWVIWVVLVRRPNDRLQLALQAVCAGCAPVRAVFVQRAWRSRRHNLRDVCARVDFARADRDGHGEGLPLHDCAQPVSAKAAEKIPPRRAGRRLARSARQPLHASRTERTVRFCASRAPKATGSEPGRAAHARRGRDAVRRDRAGAGYFSCGSESEDLPGTSGAGWDAKSMNALSMSASDRGGE